LRALEFATERHYQARRAARAARLRPIRCLPSVRRCSSARSRAPRSHKRAASRLGKTAAGDPDPEPDRRAAARTPSRAVAS
jgi:hypothetical protein